MLHRTIQMRRLHVLGVAIVCCALVSTARGASDPDDFCTGDPCVISSDVDVDHGAVVDFGTRDVRLEAKLTVGSGRATFRASTFTLAPNSRIDANGASSLDDGGEVTIETTGDIVVDGAIRANSEFGGDVYLASSSGSIRGSAPMSAKGFPEGSGGILDFTAALEIDLSGDLDASPAGAIYFLADGNIGATGLLDAGADGQVEIRNDGDVTVGFVRSNAGTGEYAEADGGWLFIYGGGDVTVAGFEAKGRAGYDCGDGGVFLVETPGDLIIDGEVDVSTQGGYCAGGTFLVREVTSVSINEEVRVVGAGGQSYGGGIEVYADGDVAVNAPLLVDGGYTGGDVTIRAEDDVHVQGIIDASARGNTYANGGFVDIISERTLTVGRTVKARGSDEGGQVNLDACNVSIDLGVPIEVKGPDGRIDVTASDALTLRGDFTAGPEDGKIDVAYGPAADPPDLTGATFNVPPLVRLISTIRSCGCAAAADCADGNACTTDVCDVDSSCRNDAIPGCTDSDGDGVDDPLDSCTTLRTTVPPATPPDQSPARFKLRLANLGKASGLQRLVAKGAFNATIQSPAVDPPENGLHLRLEDGNGEIVGLNVPGGAACAPGEGWTERSKNGRVTWTYRSRSGALPPDCTPGSANGLRRVVIKDLRGVGNRASLEFSVLAKGTTLAAVPTLPLARVGFTLALGAEVDGGASTAARAGQCAEFLLEGAPVPSRGKPSCKLRARDGQPQTLSCKGA